MGRFNFQTFTAAIATVSLFASGSAMAAAIATTTAEVTIVYDGGFQINGDNGGVANDDLVVTASNSIDFIEEFVSSVETPSTGSAVVNVNADMPVPMELAQGDSLSFSFTADSSADFRDTVASSLAALTAFIEVENTSGVQDYLIQFGIIFSFDTTVSEDKPNLQTAFAGLDFALATDIGGAALDISLAADTETGVLSQSSVSDQVFGEPFGFNVLRGETYEVTASLSGSASATSVPLPASLLFMSFALLLLHRKTS